MVDPFDSPFVRGAKERPLRLTLHSSTFANIRERDRAAVEMLQQLDSRFPIEVFRTDPELLPRLEITIPATEDQWIPITVRRKNGLRQPSIAALRTWRSAAVSLLKESSPTPGPDEVSQALADVLTAQGHIAANSDILVTSSNLLTENRENTWLRKANIYTPSEAAKIVGLFLRSRDFYWVYPRGDACRDIWTEMGNRLYFDWLAADRLPDYTRYLGPFISGSNSIYQELAQSIRDRCVRSLQLFEMIGRGFYSSVGEDPLTAHSFSMTNDNDPGLKILPHFEFLTFQLSGVLDAHARLIAHLLNLDDEIRRLEFHHRKYRKAVRDLNSPLVDGLLDLIDSHRRTPLNRRFQAVNTLIRQPRNTVHGIGMRGYAAGPGPSPGTLQPERTFVYVSLPSELEALVKGAIEDLGSTDEAWGLTVRSGRTWLEPYAYATSLVRESFRLFEAIARAYDPQGTLSHPSGNNQPLTQSYLEATGVLS